MKKMSIDKRHKIQEVDKKYPEYLIKESNLIRIYIHKKLRNNSIQFPIKTNFINSFTNSLKNMLIILLIINLFCLSFSSHIQLNTIHIYKDNEYKLIYTPLIQSFITDIKVNGNSYQGWNSFLCPCNCYYKDEDQYFYIKCKSKKKCK